MKPWLWAAGNHTNPNGVATSGAQIATPLGLDSGDLGWVPGFAPWPLELLTPLGSRLVTARDRLGVRQIS